MPNNMLLPYEGNEPYIFASYCHEDNDRVLPTISFLQRNDYRVWFDGGIQAGEDWPEVIANHLSACEVFLAFFSSASLRSHNCRREFNFAIMENKKCVIILLDDVKLTPVMRMQMATLQAIQHFDAGNVEYLCKQLLDLEILRECGAEDKTVYVPRRRAMQRYFLLRRATGERIPITHNHFKVGRKSELCDYAVADNRTMSKEHAIFFLNESGCAVGDCGSLNHIYINDTELPHSETRNLKHDDLIEMGSEQFLFIVDETTSA